MTSIARCSASVALALLTLPASGLAQAPVTGADDPESLFASPIPQLHSNKQVVLHIVRDLLEANHWDRAADFIADEYIQHNPNVQSGLQPVMAYFGSRTPTPIPDRSNWRTKVVSVVAEGDLVVVGFVREHPEPGSPGNTYTTTWFDMWRISNGKAVEHWDPATK